MSIPEELNHQQSDSVHETFSSGDLSAVFNNSNRHLMIVMRGEFVSSTIWLTPDQRAWLKTLLSCCDDLEAFAEPAP